MMNFRNRVSQYVSLSSDAWAPFESLGGSERSYLTGEDIIRAGDETGLVFIVEEGWAIRYRMLEDGRRQILNFMLAGDVFDLQSLANLQADHTITALTKLRVIAMDAVPFLDILRTSATLAAAFWWSAVQEESVLREQIVRIGRRTARERIGHLLLELRRRMNGATGEDHDDLEMPLTRTDIADALGLTPVHVSRTMSAMRRAGLISEARGRVSIADHDRLSRLCHFDTDYLHLRRLDLAQAFRGETMNAPPQAKLD